MRKYAKIINEETKLCEVGLGTNSAFYQSIGMVEMEVELGYDGAYYVAGCAPQQPLEELKQLKKDEINKARDEAEQGGFEYLGKMFDSDPVSCQRIALASQTALISKQTSQEFSIEWTCQDNSKITLSADETIGLSVALTKWSNECHIRASKLKVMIEEAETKEEVDAINWELDLSTEQDSEQVEEITSNDSENNELVEENIIEEIGEDKESEDLTSE